MAALCTDEQLNAAGANWSASSRYISSDKDDLYLYRKPLVLQSKSTDFEQHILAESQPTSELVKSTKSAITNWKINSFESVLYPNVNFEGGSFTFTQTLDGVAKSEEVDFIKQKIEINQGDTNLKTYDSVVFLSKNKNEE